MFKNQVSKILIILLIFTCTLLSAQAGEVGALTAFSPGTTAKASEVNGNFSAIKTAIDDNAIDISTNTDDIAENALAIRATGADIEVYTGAQTLPCFNVQTAPVEATCLTMALDAPADGFVLLILSAEAVTFGGNTILQLDIYHDEAATLLASAQGGRLDDGANTDRERFVLTRQVIRAVQQGTNTFSVRATKQINYDTNQVNVGRTELSGIFFKEQL